jgi:hypothetical protein
MTAEAMEWSGLMVVTTLGASANAGIVVVASAKDPAIAVCTSMRFDARKEDEYVIGDVIRDSVQQM